MKIKTLTLKDLLIWCHINYEGVEEAFTKIAHESSSKEEFLNKFHEYYSEEGLGGDDRWLDCQEYLPFILDDTD